MNDLMRQLRIKRYKVKAGCEALLRIETNTGEKYELGLDNASLTGVGGLISFLPEDEGLSLGSIIPSAQIIYKTTEIALGRVVLRTVAEKEGATLLGFSTIDSKVPVAGSLSKCLEQNFDPSEAAFEFELSPDKFSLANFAEGVEGGTDLFAKVKTYNVFMNQFKKSPKFSYFQSRKPSMGSRVRLKKKRQNGRDDYILMGTNDYLGLASHPEVCEAAKKAIDQFGFGSTGSPVTTGMTTMHEELADKTAKLFGKDRALLCTSGYATNVGLINGITRSQDLIVADMLSHASIADGMQMSKATSRFFRHNNAEHLEKILKENREDYAGCLVITEGVFSMDGDVAPFDEIIQVARKYDARVLIDEAHSFGIIGENGLGVVEKFNVMEQTDLIMGTFSKVCGALGGFVAVDEDVYNWLYAMSRAHMFSVAVPPSTAAAAIKAIEIFTTDKSLLTNIRRNIKHFVTGLANLGFDMNPNHESSVVPVIIGDEHKLGQINEILMDAGIYVVPIVFPAVPRDGGRFRFAVMATHSIADLDYVLNTLEHAMEKVGFVPQAVEA